MIIEKSSVSAKNPWRLVLGIRELAGLHSQPEWVCIQAHEEGHWTATLDPKETDITEGPILWIDTGLTATSPPGPGAVTEWNGSFVISQPSAGTRFPEIEFLRQYLPYACLPWLARNLGRAVTVAHFAQSLDGKIATYNHHSRWIGNQENLTHAHRMRALSDGILIGKGTLQADQPSLTVRHVDGPNPRRIVLASSPCNFSSLRTSSEEEIWWVGADDASPEKPQVKKLNIQEEGCSSRCEALLRALFQQGIYSVLVEGGATTTSEFLDQEMIDILQLHLSPMLFGSGISGIQLPEITSVDQAVRFDSHAFFAVGDAMMFVGKPSPKS